MNQNAIFRFSPFRIFVGLAFLWYISAQSLSAQEIVMKEGAEEAQSGMFVIPFVFYNDMIGASAGVSLAGRGWPQDTAQSYLSVVQSIRDTTYLYLNTTDLELPYSDRLFVDVDLGAGRYNQINSYVDGNPDYPNQDAGSNNSSKHNYIEGSGYDNMITLDFQYIMPWGHGRANPKSKVWIRDGIVVKGGRNPGFWNPASSGTSSLLVSPFFRRQDIDSDEAGESDHSTLGAEFAVRYDNTDFSENPSYGSMQQLRLTRDPGWFDSTAEWTTWDFEWAKYLYLGKGGGARQRVLALDFWTSDTLSWNDSVSEGSDPHRPPAYTGSTLGGLHRMRGFPQNRFYDRSAIYYTAEYRHTLDWNPLKGNSVLNYFKLDVDWIQLVGFVEAGRVAPTFDLQELHTEMQSDIGTSLRFFANTLVMRIDLAVSEEDTTVNMMVDHPF